MTAIALLPAGCVPGPVRSVRNPDPLGSVPAIEDAVARHDLRIVPRLVTDLEDSDPAIRFYAIQGLRRLTGQDFGYHYYLEEPARRPAVQLWKDWQASHASELH